MINFFKNFGKGILYVFVLPFLLAGMAIYAVVALFVFIYLAIKGLVLFFTGRSLYEDLPEDKEAKKRIAIANGTYQEPKPAETTVEETPIKQETTIDNDPFYVPEYMKTEEQKAQVEEEKQEALFEPEPEVQIEEEPVVENTVTEEKDVILPQKDTQNATILEINDEMEDDDNDRSGIHIDFE